MPPRKLCLSGITGLMHIHIQKDSMHRTCTTSSQIEDPWLRGSNRHSIPPLANNLHQVDIYLKEKIVFSNGVSLDILAILQDKTHAQQQTANTKFSTVFVQFFLGFKLFWRNNFIFHHCWLLYCKFLLCGFLSVFVFFLCLHLFVFKERQ